MKLPDWLSTLRSFHLRGCPNRSRRKTASAPASSGTALRAAPELLEDRTLPATIAWDGGGATDHWSEAANWDGDSIPTATDDALFDASDTAIVDGDFTVHSFTMNGGDVSVEAGGHTLSVQTDFTINAGTFDPGDGTVRFLIGPWQLDTGGADLYDLVISGFHNRNFTATSPVTVLNDLHLLSLGRISNDFEVGGDLILAGVGGVDGTLHVQGDVLTSDDVVDGPGRILLDNTNDQQVFVTDARGGVPALEINKPAGQITIGPAENRLTVGSDWRFLSGGLDLQSDTVEFVGGSPEVEHGGVPFENLVISTGVHSDFTPTSPVTVLNDLTLTNLRHLRNDYDVGGDLVIGGVSSFSGTVNVQGNVTTADPDVDGPGRLLLNNTSDQTITVAADTGGLPGLEINKPAGTVTIGPAENTLTVSRDWQNLSGELILQTETVEFTRVVSHVETGGVPFHNLVINQIIHGDFIPASPVTVNNDLHLKRARHLHNDFDVGGDLIIDDVASFTDTVNVQGDVISNDSLVGGVGLIVMDGIDDATISGGDFPDGGIVVNKDYHRGEPGVVTPGTDLDVSSATVMRGVLDLAAHRLTADTLTVDANGFVRVHIEEPATVLPIDVDGKVTLAGTLTGTVAAGLEPEIGDQFPVIDNAHTDAIDGTLLSVPEGGTILIGDQMFAVSYIGGTGNDLVLTANGGSIHGTKWNDLNGNGERDTGEPGMAEISVYLDLNNNGVHDAGEPITETLFDDPTTPSVNETGTYSFVGLEAGEYTVRESVTSDWVQTYPWNPAFADGEQPLERFFSEYVALGDLNADGHLDVFLAVASFGSDVGNRVLFNEDGLFRDSGQSLDQSAFGHSAGNVELADLDNDMDLDAVVVANGPNHVWWNNGHGIFTKGPWLGNSFAGSLALGDLDDDGDLDIVIEQQPPYRNNGDGTFTAMAGPVLPRWASPALGDVDNDGDLDMVVVTQNLDDPQPVEVWLNDGSGLLADSGLQTDPLLGLDVELGDFDKDGDLDAIVGGTGRETIWFNDGSGVFTHVQTLPFNGNSHSVVLGDLNGDDYLDVFVADISTFGNSIALNDGTGTFIPSFREFGGASSLGGDLGDIDNDGDLDIFVPHRREVDRVWINAGLAGDPAGYQIDVHQGFAVRNVDFGNRPNQAPVADAGGPYSVAEGGTVTLDASATTDPDEPAGSLLYEWDLDDDGDFDDAVGITPDFSATLLDGPDTVTISLRVTDEGGAQDIASALVDISNVDPALTNVSSSSLACGGSAHGDAVHVTAGFTDAGLPDTHVATIDWGDGTVTSGTVTRSQGSGTIDGTHTYAVGGIYTVTVTLTDDDGGSAMITTSTTIAGVGLHGGTLTIVGTDDIDVVRVRMGAVAVVDATLGLLDPMSSQFSVSEIDRIEMLLCDGDDTAAVSGFNAAGVPTMIDGGHGDDTLHGGRGPDTLIGGAGDDDLRGGRGDDQIEGGADEDRLYGGRDDDVLLGDAGDDYLNGGRDNDQLDGGDDDDELMGGPGNDGLAGGDGADSLHGGPDDDTLDGGAGDDYLFGSRGHDTIEGGFGHDDLRGGPGDDNLLGQAGDDHLNGGPGNDTLDGADGDDFLNGSIGDDSLDGGTGDDDMYGSRGHDELFGGEGDDELMGGRDDDVLHGGAGGDVLSGRRGHDLLLGGADEDQLIGGPDRDVLIGGEGSDDLDGRRDDDILIAGTTSYDADPLALDAIMAEWTSGADYQTRVDNLRTGAGPHLGGVALVAGSTVADDGIADALRGHRGQDWFFARVSGPVEDDDLLLDLGTGELLDAI